MSVELSLMAQRYLSGIKQAERGTATFDRSVKESTESVKAAESALDRFAARSKKLNDIGNDWTTKVTLPIAAAAGAATKLATDYNNTFTQMQSLAGVAAEEVDGLKASVDQLSGETARSPQELAEGLYNVRSSGLEGAAALDVLDVSAKGAAIGLGETRSLTDMLTSVMNAYAGSGLTAAQATDQLIAAIAAGKAEPAEMAGQMGRLLPLASELGVEFDQVAGSLGFLTLTSGDTAQSATQLSGILQKLIRPSKQGAAELESVGLSSEKLRDIVANKGLLPALQLLDDKFKGNSERMGKVFEDSEGLVGVLSLLRDGGRPAAKVLDEVANSAGGLDTAFERLQETDEFKFTQAVNDLKRVGVEVGQELIPVLSDMAGVASDMLGMFNALPGPVRDALLMLATGAALVGPTAKALGGVASGIGKINELSRKSSVAGFTSKLQGLEGAATAGGVALGGAALILGVWLDGVAQAKAQTEAWNRELRTMADEALNTGRSIDAVFRENTLLDWANTDAGTKTIQLLGINLDELADKLMAGEEEWQAYWRGLGLGDQFASMQSIQLATLRSGLEDTRAAYERLKTTKQELGVVDDETAAKIQMIADVARSAVDPTYEAATATEALAGASFEASDGAKSLIEMSDELADAYEELEKKIDDAYSSLSEFYGLQTSTLETEAAVLESIQRFGDTVRGNIEDSKKGARGLDILTEAGRDNFDAMTNARDAAVEHALNVARTTGDIDQGILALAGYADEIRRAGKEAGLSETEVDFLIAKMKLTPTDIETTFRTELADVDATEAALTILSRTREILMRPKLDLSKVGEHVFEAAVGVFARREGGIDNYARGGVRPAMLGSGKNMIWWDEPETGGEAYIPRLGGRNVESVLGTAAGWHGYGLHKLAAGGVMGGPIPVAAAPSAPIMAPPQVTVVVQGTGGNTSYGPVNINTPRAARDLGRRDIETAVESVLFR